MNEVEIYRAALARQLAKRASSAWRWATKWRGRTIAHAWTWDESQVVFLTACGIRGAMGGGKWGMRQCAACQRVLREHGIEPRLPAVKP